jgi:hypothetical protein
MHFLLYTFLHLLRSETQIFIMRLLYLYTIKTCNKYKNNILYLYKYQNEYKKNPIMHIFIFDLYFFLEILRRC